MINLQTDMENGSRMINITTIQWKRLLHMKTKWSTYLVEVDWKMRKSFCVYSVFSSNFEAVGFVDVVAFALGSLLICPVQMENTTFQIEYVRRSLLREYASVQFPTFQTKLTLT